MRFHSFSDPSVISPSRLSYELTDLGHLGLNCHDFGSDLLSPHINVNFRLSLSANLMTLLSVRFVPRADIIDLRVLRQLQLKRDRDKYNFCCFNLTGR